MIWCFILLVIVCTTISTTTTLSDGKPKKADSIANGAWKPTVWMGTAPFCDTRPYECELFDMEFVMADPSGDGSRCLTGEKVLCRARAAPTKVNTDPYHLKVVTYNVYERPFYISHDGQTERTCHIPRALLRRIPDLDVIMFNELFMFGCMHEESLGMEHLLKLHGFTHFTKTVGVTSYFVKLLNGGISIASRWPITFERQHVFDSAHGLEADQFSSKGVIYARIDKRGQKYHLFGSHLQAEDGASVDQTRREQAKEFAAFVDRQKIPAEEPVIIGGDLNADTIHEADHFEAVRKLLKLRVFAIVGNQTSTMDPEENPLALDVMGSRHAWIDFVGARWTHRQPRRSTLEAVPLRAHREFDFCFRAPLVPVYVGPWQWTCRQTMTTAHLSDHYPVLAVMDF